MQECFTLVHGEASSRIMRVVETCRGTIEQYLKDMPVSMKNKHASRDQERRWRSRKRPWRSLKRSLGSTIMSHNLDKCRRLRDEV